MKTYQVCITETRQIIKEVEAKNEKEAVEKVRQLYRSEEVILNDSDFIRVDFEVHQEAQ